MTRTTGMLIGYVALITGWQYENMFLILAGMLIAFNEASGYFKEREENDGS